MRDIEIGSIRPPSESNSLLIRVTRGCHWNKCYFCGLYKSMRFSMRPIDETIEDIRRQAQLNRGKKITSCFLQDGDALVLKTDYLLRILNAINQNFPDMQYITSYARADSITRKNPAELKALRQAGLNHLYSGMETGSDRILKLINKGFDADTVVRSGCMAKDADMILSEFILLGIGGKELSEENAAQTAKALNIIQPDFIRVHATGIKPESKLGEFVRDGSFTLQSEEEIVIEQKLFLQQLHEMDSYYVNEHIVNLLLEVRGNLRTEKQEMLSTIDRFLTLPPDERLLFTVGRRLNIFFRLDDLKKPKLHQKAGESLQQILSKNPHVDFAALCNYVRQSQIKSRKYKLGIAAFRQLCQHFICGFDSMAAAHPGHPDSCFPTGTSRPEWVRCSVQMK